ncbi:uncharacterized protein LOC123701487 [Colias croceus]|uniref:uncharacterized protein LOC123701487 n=1 Tax=Colias crocea TaxID=72248 RepID=UPI001E27C8B1|nr:uncharacterized protein LOC123701487 [Colias croceus]
MASPGPSRGLAQTNYKIISNKLGGRTLLHVGFAYNLHRKNNKSSVWTCVNKRHGKCSGSIKLSEESDNVQIQKCHNAECQPNLMKNEVRVVMEKLKKEVKTSFSSSIQQKFETKFAELKNTDTAFDEYIPKFNNIKQQLYNSRKKALNVEKTQFRNPAEVIIPEIFQKYLLVDYCENDNRIIVFVSAQALKHIKNIQHYFGDGTFDCCPGPFYQIFTIHGDMGSDAQATNIVPIFYVLLVNKEKSTYEVMFKKIKEAVPDFSPMKFTVDFELATMLAIKEVLPAVTIHGCNVHFQRAIYRKAKSLGLLAHEETTLYVKLCTCLAFLPKEDIEDGWLSVMENSIPDEKVTQFNDYFVEQWLEPPGMISKWCCYKERHRTTNLVEARNQRLQCYLGRKPSLLSFLEIITTDISTYSTGQVR